jgi:prepilin-type N-terminal cleavage/methylation domain-containing protein/prepilin-type processing-associated H-X9-DG protein
MAAPRIPTGDTTRTVLPLLPAAGALPQARSRGFTLVELLVVIAIIGTLVGLLLPAVQAAREAARRMACTNNLKQIGLAITLHHDARKSFPSGRNTRDNMGVSWAYRILPYMEESSIYNAYKPTFRCDAPENAGAMRYPVSAFYCPSRRPPLADRNFDNDNSAPLVTGVAAGSDYAANAGSYFNYSPTASGGVDPRQAGPIHTFSKVTASQVTDGLSQTFAVGDKHIPPVDPSWQPNMAQYWQGDLAIFAADNPNTQFRDTARGLASSPRDTNARKFGGLHPIVTNFVFLDGHVEAIANDAALDVLRWYSTIGDGNDPTAPADGPDSGT